MESVPPQAGSEVSRVPAQRTPPGQPATDPATPPPAPRRRRLRLVLTVVAGALALLCLAGGAITYLLYDNYTAPDRSAPDVVVDNYLRAFLVDHNDVRAELFTCQDPSLDQVRALRAEAERRETQFDVVVRISWGTLERSRTDTGEAVRTSLTIAGFAAADGQPRSSRREDWSFEVVDQDGWRVCSARRVA